jgi:hypothetical protein
MAIIVTLSRYHDLLGRLQDSVDTHEPDARGICVFSHLLPPKRKNWLRIEGEHPFIFGRNVNSALRYCGEDVLLINDDCQLTGPILDTMSKICTKNPKIGLLSPQVDGGVGNDFQKYSPPSIHPAVDWYESPCRLAFVCVYVPYRTRRSIGYLSEVFTGYGGEDDEYCRRVRKAGLSLAVTPQAVIKHGEGEDGMSTSFLRTMTLEERNKSMKDMLSLERSMRNV